MTKTNLIPYCSLTICHAYLYSKNQEELKLWFLGILKFLKVIQVATKIISKQVFLYPIFTKQVVQVKVQLQHWLRTYSILSKSEISRNCLWWESLFQRPSKRDQKEVSEPTQSYKNFVPQTVESFVYNPVDAIQNPHPFNHWLLNRF